MFYYCVKRILSRELLPP
uniref:Uncharacterized protein n=1 Tax=Amphimedon queenslandica TaxID=400682 RepID=A0A1X7SZK4_AMPQE